LAKSIGQTPSRILAVIVLYRTHPAESQAFNTLLAAKANLDSEQTEVQILLYDNTPGGLDPGSLPEGVRYEAAGENAGLASAYNRALSIAQHQQSTWLLTLDQDTTLPPDYLYQICRIASEVEADSSIAAIVPRMLDRGRPVAPVFIRFWGASYAAADCQGTSPREVHATNSATLFRVSSLKQIGGFSPYFWLDYLDGYVFHQLHAHGGKVYIARDIEVVHELSLLHGGNLTPVRFHNILRAESAYWDLYGTPVQRLAFDTRLLLRTGRQRRRGHPSAITKLTWNELKRRAFHSKAQRIAEWKREMEHQLSHSSPIAEEPLQGFPSISVCMAAYNGERYIKAQLQSILQQLRPTDQVIVVEDASSDSTRQIVASFQDHRIQIIPHEINQGVLRSFEEAIRAASREVLFLSDQDDLWAPDRVLATLRIFQLHPAANIVVSDAALVSEQGLPIAPSYYAQLGGFRAGVLPNLVHCRYLGCTMAFRSRLRKQILPFPVGQSVLHDLWIGVLNAFLGGETIYTDRPLVLYRRHPLNATGNHRLPLARQLKIRWNLCASLLSFWFRNRRAIGSSPLPPSNRP
jgi:glycosyltransferase involved in cell wall biosynthesis